VEEEKTKGKPAEKEGKPERLSEEAKKGLRPGFGLGLLITGSSYSSRNPPLQLGQTRSEVGEGVMETVRLHWWQKYSRGWGPPLPESPLDDMIFFLCYWREKRKKKESLPLLFSGI
jgi:hypothetical protein